MSWWQNFLVFLGIKKVKKRGIPSNGKIKGKEIVLNCHNCKKIFEESEKILELKIWWLETGLIKICNDCSNEISERCHNCHLPIYKTDLVYEILISRSAEYFVGASEEEKKIQCKSCYQGWLMKQKKKIWVNWGLFILLVIFAICLLFLAIPLFNPDIVGRWERISQFRKFFLIFLSFIIPIIIYWIIKKFGDRYKEGKK